MIRQILGGVPMGAIVRYEGKWGVVCVDRYREEGRPQFFRQRIVDFWETGRERLPDRTEVDYMVGTGGGWPV